MWRSEDNLKGLVLFFHYVDPGNQTQTISPGHRHLYATSHVFVLELVLFASAYFFQDCISAIWEKVQRFLACHQSLCICLARGSLPKYGPWWNAKPSWEAWLPGWTCDVTVGSWLALHGQLALAHTLPPGGHHGHGLHWSGRVLLSMVQGCLRVSSTFQRSPKSKLFSSP